MWLTQTALHSYLPNKQAVHSVLRHVADQHKLWLEDLYKQVGWPLYRKYGHAFDAFSKYLL